MAWTSDDLVTAVRRSADLASGRLSTSDLLALADEQIAARVTPTIMDVKEDYWLTHSDTTLTVGTPAYRIPSRAVGGTVRQVVIITDDGLETEPLTNLRPNEVWWWQQETSATPRAYTLSGDRVTLYPTPNEALTLRVKYIRRPSKLVPVSDCGVIDACSVGDPSTTIDVTTVPSGFPATSGSAHFDVVQGRPNFDLLLTDVLGTRSSSPSDRFSFTTADVPDGAEIASDVSSSRTNYLCLADQTCVPQVPAEAHAILAHLTAGLALETIGDRAAADMKYTIAGHMMDRFVSTIDPRNQGGARRIVTRNSVFDVW